MVMLMNTFLNYNESISQIKVMRKKYFQNKKMYSCICGEHMAAIEKMPPLEGKTTASRSRFFRCLAPRDASLVYQTGHVCSNQWDQSGWRKVTFSLYFFRWGLLKVWYDLAFFIYFLLNCFFISETWFSTPNLCDHCKRAEKLGETRSFKNKYIDFTLSFVIN